MLLGPGKDSPLSNTKKEGSQDLRVSTARGRWHRKKRDYCQEREKKKGSEDEERDVLSKRANDNRVMQSDLKGKEFSI